MPTKTCNTCNLTLDISNFGKAGKWYRNKCKQCRNDEQKCKHDKRKRDCPECNPKFLCKHDKRKHNCPECSPQNFCEHKKYKANCPKCSPQYLCKHDSRKKDCRECSPHIVCKHDMLKRRCYKCNPCEHGNWKQMCIKCGGSKLCIHCKHISGTLRYVESVDKKIKCCAGCFYYYYPNDEIPRRYKKKQHYFNEKLIEEFGVNFFQYDKKIKCGCSGRMPDWFIDCFKYSIIIELDEDQHKYESCDEKRMMELFQDLGNRPLVLIRINPDKYKGKTKKRKGCFDFDEKNILICNEKKFNKRFNILVKMIKYYIDNEPEKEITMEKLFFDRN